jgi:hypothetical protein
MDIGFCEPYILAIDIYGSNRLEISEIDRISDTYLVAPFLDRSTSSPSTLVFALKTDLSVLPVEF